MEDSITSSLTRDQNPLLIYLDLLVSCKTIRPKCFCMLAELIGGDAPSPCSP